LLRCHFTRSLADSDIGGNLDLQRCREARKERNSMGNFDGDRRLAYFTDHRNHHNSNYMADC